MIKSLQHRLLPKRENKSRKQSPNKTSNKNILENKKGGDGEKVME